MKKNKKLIRKAKNAPIEQVRALSIKETIEGFYLGFKTIVIIDGPGSVPIIMYTHYFALPTGTEGIFGTSKLNLLLKGIRRGVMVRVTRNEDVCFKLGKSFKDFDVQYDPELFMESKYFVTHVYKSK